MTQEEKAKAYDEALERAKQYSDGHTLDVNPQKAMEYIFPELKESEDERIRKSLIKSYTNQHSSNFPTVDGFTREQILAWLEKQGSQKSTWSEKDEMMFRSLSNSLTRISSNTRTENYSFFTEINWLKALKEKLKGGAE